MNGVVLRNLQMNGKDMTLRLALPNLASTEKIIYVNSFTPSTPGTPPWIFGVGGYPTQKTRAGVGYTLPYPTRGKYG